MKQEPTLTELIAKYPTLEEAIRCLETFQAVIPLERTLSDTMDERVERHKRCCLNTLEVMKDAPPDRTNRVRQALKQIDLPEFRVYLQERIDFDGFKGVILEGVLACLFAKTRSCGAKRY